MANLAIVAIPAEDDYVHKISSEKIPHMTLLFLGETSNVPNIAKIVDFVRHASEQSLTCFGMDVDRRAVLGEDKADVLFFSKSRWSGFETIRDFRSYLLKENNIRTAYDSTEQFPEWIPHLTLGYPESPAKKDTRDYPGIKYVSFDRIAVWDKEFDGIEFPLKSYEWDMETAMSNGAIGNIVQNVLKHHGVKGMRWGVRRKATVGPTEVVVSDKRKKVKTKGGKGHPATEPAVRARVIGQKAKKSGLKSLTDDELNAYAKRIQMEQNVSRLMYNEKSRGAKFVDSFLGRQGSQLANKAAQEGGAKLGRQVIKKSARAAALAAA